MKKIFTVIAVLSCAIDLLAQAPAAHLTPHWVKANVTRYNYSKPKSWHKAFLSDSCYLYDEKVLYKSMNPDSEMSRIVTYSCVVHFRHNGIERSRIKDSVNYYIDYMDEFDNGTVVFRRSRMSFHDVVNELLSDDTSNSVTGSPIRNFEQVPGLMGKRHTYKKGYRLDKRYAKTGSTGFWYLSLNYAPSIGYRSTNINNPQFSSQNELDTRRRNERPVYGQVINGQIGFTFRSVNTFFVEYNTARFGFNTNKKVDIKSGSLDPASLPDNEYQYRYYRNGLGIGYNYSGYKKLMNAVFETGLYYYFAKTFDGSQYDDGGKQIKIDQDARDAGIQPNFFGLKAGLGFNIRYGYKAEIKFVPTLYYNLTAFNKGEIATRFYNIGLCAGFAYRL